MSGAAVDPSFRTVSGTVGAFTSCSLKYCKDCIVQVFFCSSCWKRGDTAKFKHESDCELQRERKTHDQFRQALSRQIEALENQRLDLQKELQEKDLQIAEARKMTMVMQRSAEMDLDKRRQMEDDLATSLKEISKLHVQLEEEKINFKAAFGRQERESIDVIDHMRKTESQLCKRLGELEEELEKARETSRKTREQADYEIQRAWDDCAQQVATAQQLSQKALDDLYEKKNQWLSEQKIRETSEMEILEAFRRVNEEKDDLVKEVTKLQQEISALELAHEQELRVRSEVNEEDNLRFRSRCETQIVTCNERLASALDENAQLKIDLELANGKSQERVEQLQEQVQDLEDKMQREIAIQSELTQRCAFLNRTLVEKDNIIAGLRHNALEKLHKNIVAPPVSADSQRLKEARQQASSRLLRVNSPMRSQQMNENGDYFDDYYQSAHLQPREPQQRGEDRHPNQNRHKEQQNHHRSRHHRGEDIGNEPRHHVETVHSPFIDHPIYPYHSSSPPAAQNVIIVHPSPQPLSTAAPAPVQKQQQYTDDHEQRQQQPFDFIPKPSSSSTTFSPSPTRVSISPSFETSFAGERLEASSIINNNNNMSRHYTAVSPLFLPSKQSPSPIGNANANHHHNNSTVFVDNIRVSPVESTANHTFATALRDVSLSAQNHRESDSSAHRRRRKVWLSSSSSSSSSAEEEEEEEKSRMSNNRTSPQKAAALEVSSSHAKLFAETKERLRQSRSHAAAVSKFLSQSSRSLIASHRSPPKQ